MGEGVDVAVAVSVAVAFAPPGLEVGEEVAVTFAPTLGVAEGVGVVDGVGVGEGVGVTEGVGVGVALGLTRNFGVSQMACACVRLQRKSANPIDTPASARPTQFSPALPLGSATSHGVV